MFFRDPLHCSCVYKMASNDAYLLALNAFDLIDEVEALAVNGIRNMTDLRYVNADVLQETTLNPSQSEPKEGVGWSMILF